MLRGAMTAPIALTGLAVALAAILVMEVQVADDRAIQAVAGTPTTPPAPFAVPADNIIADTARANIAATMARPLFDPSRRPAAGAPSAGPAQIPRLTAIVISDDERRAIFAGENARSVVAGVGARVGDYTVQSIQDGHVTLLGPGGLRDLRPRFANTGAEPEPEKPSILQQFLSSTRASVGVPGLGGAPPKQ